MLIPLEKVRLLAESDTAGVPLVVVLLVPPPQPDIIVRAAVTRRIPSEVNIHLRGIAKSAVLIPDLRISTPDVFIALPRP
jgi:hypothetical protein